MLVGGVLGAVVIPPISDRLRRRKAFILGGMVLAVPGMLGLAWATTLTGLAGSVFSLGFFLVATSPIGMQYSTEITRPTPEGTSNGLIQLFGQVSVVFVYVMEALRTESGSFVPSLLLAAVLLAICAFLATRLVDPAREVA
jgi:MFS family permease